MINFSKYKLQLTEGLATSTGTATSLDASQKSSGNSVQGADTAQTQKQMGNERLRRQRAQKADPRGAGQVFEDLRKQKEIINSYEAQKSDWRSELQEKVVDGQERQQHPYVTVMPTGDENLLQAVEQMAKTAKGKKESVKEGVLDAAKKSSDDYEKLMKDTDKDTERVRKGGKFNYKSVKEGVLDAAKKSSDAYKKLMDDTDKDTERVRKGGKFNYKKEEVEQEETLEEAKKKKKCKKGYKRDKDGNCVKEKSSKTTIIVGRGWGYGGGHHHHDNDNDENDNGGGGDSGGSSGEGGGMSEMFDILGDMLLKEKQLSIDDQMRISRKYNRMSPEEKKAANKKAMGNVKKVAPKKDTRTDAQKMTDAVGKPRMGSSD